MHTMTATIGRLRALLLDEGWSEDHRADALRTLAEIEAAWDALLAPDVEAALGALLGAMRGVPPSCAADVADVLRPLVEDRARLAREVERLRAEIARVEEEGQREHDGVLDKISEELGALYPERGPYPSLESARAEIASARAEIARLAREVAGLRGIVRAANGLAGKARAEIARLTAEVTEHRAALDAVADLGRGYAVARDRAVDAVASGTAAPGEAWERLRERAQFALDGEHHPDDDGELSFVGRRAMAALRSALAAVEPRGPDAFEMLARATPEQVRKLARAVRGEAPEPRAGTIAADPSAHTVGVEAITHDFRAGAQDGMPRLADVEASEIASPPVHPDLARRLAGSIATRPVQGSVTAAELAEVVRLAEGSPDTVETAWLKSAARSLALAQQARREAPAMTAERALVDINAHGIGTPRASRGCPCWACKPLVAQSPTPPRALTEAEALLVLRDRLRARAKSDRAAGPLSEWGRGSAYTLDLVARYIDREPAAVGVLEGPDAANAAALAASRDDVPPEAREATACNVDHTPGERPRVTGGECADCLHRPPLHEPTCTKARCTHVVEICEGCDKPVSECVCDEGRRARASEARTEQIREAWYRAQETGRPGHERPREADDLACGWEHVRAALHGKAV